MDERCHEAGSHVPAVVRDLRESRPVMRTLGRALVFSAAAALAIALTTSTVTSLAGTDVVTYHNDVARTGQNLTETILTPASVGVSTFGKLAVFPADGKVDAQPLYLSSVTIPGGGAHDVLYVATEHDTVYAMDAVTGAVLWRTSLLGAGETTSDARSCSQVVPEIGITATPVIDRSRGANGVIYVVAMSKDSGGTYFQRLHALDAALGTELLGGPQTVQASFPGSGAGSSNGSVVFDPKQYEERAGLLLLNGQIITTWTSHCDIDPYTGWIIAFDAGTLARSSVLNVTPNGSRGAMWMAGAGPAADALGNFYVLDGNGTFDTTLTASGFPNRGDFGNAFLKIATGGGLSVADYFATFDTVSASNADTDLGSGGALVLPDLVDATGRTRHLAVGAGKDAHIYVVDRDSMGKWNASSNQIYQDIAGALGGPVFSMPAYFDGNLYYGASGRPLRAFSITSARLSSAPTTSTAASFTFPGTTPSVSASGTANGIVWAVENRNPAVLHAYDARDLTRELYNSTLAANSRDAFGAGNKFITPTIANGRVYVGTTSGVGVFGAFGPSAPIGLKILSP
jgi:PQQ-like domain